MNRIRAPDHTIERRKSRGPAKNSEMDLMPVFILFEIEIMKELKTRNLILDN